MQVHDALRVPLNRVGRRRPESEERERAERDEGDEVEPPGHGTREEARARVGRGVHASSQSGPKASIPTPV